MPRKQINKIVKKITTSVHSVAASTSVAVVDMVYGLHPDSTTGGCVVQRSFEDSLRAEGITSIRVHVASTPSSAERVFHRLLGIDGQGESGIVRSCCGKAIPRVLIVDGIALMFMRDRLRALKEETPARLLVGFVHFPFRCGKGPGYGDATAQKYHTTVQMMGRFQSNPFVLYIQLVRLS